MSAWHKPLLWPNVNKFALVARPVVAAERIDGGRKFRVFSPDPELLGGAAAKHPHATLYSVSGRARSTT